MDRYRMITLILSMCLAAGGVFQPGAFTAPGSAYAEDAWKTEFEDVCSRTQDAMDFSVEELKGLVARCDAIKPQIEQLQNESQRTVMLKRLKLCRDLFAFVLEDKESTQRKEK